MDLAARLPFMFALVCVVSVCALAYVAIALARAFVSRRFHKTHHQPPPPATPAPADRLDDGDDGEELPTNADEIRRELRRGLRAGECNEDYDRGAGPRPGPGF